MNAFPLDIIQDFPFIWITSFQHSHTRVRWQLAGIFIKTVGLIRKTDFPRTIKKLQTSPPWPSLPVLSIQARGLSPLPPFGWVEAKLLPPLLLPPNTYLPSSWQHQAWYKFSLQPWLKLFKQFVLFGVSSFFSDFGLLGCGGQWAEWAPLWTACGLYEVFICVSINFFLLLTNYFEVCKIPEVAMYSFRASCSPGSVLQKRSFRWSKCYFVIKWDITSIIFVRTPRRLDSWMTPSP